MILTEKETTAIKESPSRVAEADKLYSAFEVEPVFKPVHPE